MTAANAYAPAFMADFNQRFAKPPRSDLDVHRPVRQDEDLYLIFTVRQLRKVSHVLTLQYEKAIYLLADTAFTRALIGKYIDVLTIRMAGSRSVLQEVPCPMCAMTTCQKSIKEPLWRTSDLAMSCK
jgi:hypothetical protein